MNTLIGLYGESSVGKTAVAKALGKRLRVKVRHCGEVVKDHARKLGLDFRLLPDSEHNIINKETKAIAENIEGTYIMEGRFLDQVLKGVPNVLLIHLKCSEVERLRRAKKAQKAHTKQALKISKNNDSGEAFHKKTKRGKNGCNNFTIDTEGQTINKVVGEVLACFKEYKNDAS